MRAIPWILIVSLVAACVAPSVKRSPPDESAVCVLDARFELHNHPFLLDRKPGDRTWATEDTLGDIAGALVPSLTDVQAYRRMREAFGLQGAWITNGLDSARYSAEDFDRLSAWP